MGEKLWYREAVFYEVYVRAYADSNQDGHGDFRGLMSKLDFIQALGIDCIWLQPFYLSPLKDDGYDVADYYNILPEYGALDDLKELLRQAHARGIKVIADLVLNHTSDQHAWFQAARRDRHSPYRDYYVWSDSDQKYQDARIIFIDTEQSNWTWDEQAGQYYWHRFYASQPDLNYDNPALQEEMLRVISYWLDLGLDGFRADAVPYLFERQGTNCENLPETHAYLKRIRAFLDQHYPQAILLCEANQWPEDVRPYFGNGDEFHMGFHFPLMPRLYYAIKKERRDALVWIMERTPSIPDNCQWCTFLRNHDELTLEMVSEEERQYLWQQYAPEARMRLNLGIRRRLAPLMDGDPQRILLMNSLLFSLPGSPILYYGDEIGMGDNIWLFDRNGVRTPMQWSAAPNAGFSSAAADQLYAPVIEGSYGPQHVNVADQTDNPHSQLHHIRQMIAVRKAHPAFSRGAMQWADGNNPAIAAYWRSWQDEHLLIINNLSAAAQTARIQLPQCSGCTYTDLLSGQSWAAGEDGTLVLEMTPHAYLWLAD